ncbi:MAG: threonine/homoserine/homoserine lactone efflux protein [Planctomycetota bacterium]|jgi:threonine/homoserine/homoserine lactone efflux protein
METANWITIATVCLAGAMTPGPSLAVVVKNTVAGGRAQGVLTGVGHGLGVGIYAFSAVCGVAALLEAAPGVSVAIEMLGGLYLIWMGISALRPADDTEKSEHAASRRTGFAEGFAIAFLNPKIAVFFLALLGSFLPPDAALLDSAGVALLAMAIDATWYVVVALLLVATGAAGWLAVRGRGMELVLGVLLIGIGAFLAIAAAREWSLGLA